MSERRTGRSARMCARSCDSSSEALDRVAQWLAVNFVVDDIRGAEPDPGRRAALVANPPLSRTDAWGARLPGAARALRHDPCER